MSDLQLTPDEIFGITGKIQPAAQIKHLRRMGVRAERSDNPDQPVCVLRAWLAPQQAVGAESRPRLKSDREGNGQAAHAR